MSSLHTRETESQHEKHRPEVLKCFGIRWDREHQSFYRSHSAPGFQPALFPGVRRMRRRMKPGLSQQGIPLSSRWASHLSRPLRPESALEPDDLFGDEAESSTDQSDRESSRAHLREISRICKLPSLVLVDSPR